MFTKFDVVIVGSGAKNTQYSTPGWAANVSTALESPGVAVTCSGASAELPPPHADNNATPINPTSASARCAEACDARRPRWIRKRRAAGSNLDERVDNGEPATSNGIAMGESAIGQRHAASPERKCRNASTARPRARG